MRLDLKENLNYPMADPNWIVKTLIGAACQFFVISAPILTGYQLAIIRQTANGEDGKLPEYEDLGNLWIQGFMVMLVMGAIFMLPSIAIAVATGTALYVSAGTLDAAEGPAVLLILALAGLALAVTILGLAFLAPALILRYALTGNMSSLFDFSTAWGDIQHGFSDYLLIAAFPILASIVSMIFMTVTAGIGALLAPLISVFILMIQARMIGSYYRLYFQ